jgi:transposase-like protein
MPAEGGRWYVAYPISYRQLEEMMGEHGVKVDHATLNRWVLKCPAVGGDRQC